MKTQGTISATCYDYASGSWMMQLQVEAPIDIKGPVDVSIVKHREKRSLDANSYYWVLAGKIAQKLGVPDMRVHNDMLRAYGTLETVDGCLVDVMFPDDQETFDRLLLTDTYHVRPTDDVYVLDSDGSMKRRYYLIKGSRRYDTAEMTRLIDGIVSEAKALGIPTETPDEILRMEQEWGI